MEDLAKKMTSAGLKKTESCHRRVRLLKDGAYIADTTEALYVWEWPYYPQYYIPTKHTKLSIPNPSNNDKTAAYSSLPAPYSGFVVHDPSSPLKDYIRFDWPSIDAWFEEDEQIFVHPRDPFKRVDCLPSSRRITVKLNDVELADATNVVMLFETSLPTRYYLPATSVRWDLLKGSETVTSCPYKGDANYHSVVIEGKEFVDLVWYYKHPTRESAPVEGRLCFYNEKVDIYVDGVKQERPKTKFG
ncbi:hypothetical protein MMC25_001327 [Agyrium rufum]|nr:hypothetical protein [Agyrium rufum]